MRYALTVDCEAAELVDCAGGTAVVDVWIDDEGRVRRVRSEQRDDEFEVEFFDFGADVEIDPPPADEVQEAPEHKSEPCARGEERPVRVEQAVAVLRGHGFDLSPDEAACSGGLVAALHGDDSDPELLSCIVVRRPPEQLGGVVVTEATILGGSGLRRTERKLANLECTLFQEGQSGEAVERLDAAFAELKRAVGP